MTTLEHAHSKDSDNIGDASLGAAPLADNQRETLRNFSIGNVLGEGSFSTVLLGTERATNTQYAIKMLDKRHIVKERKVKYVTVEKNVLGRLKHPYIVRLHSTFQDATSLYFVLEYAPNGDLLDRIKTLGSFPLELARFYAAELLLALEYLHKEHILHRDVKPENILLDAKMHIRLTDFGSAKDLLDPVETTPPTTTTNNPSPPSRSRAVSFVGTAEYVSPELLVEKETSTASDVWAFACVLFHMLTGRPPFKASNEYQIFQKITKLEYAFPGDPHAPPDPSSSSPAHVSETAKDLIRSVLVLDPKQRPNWEQIKLHPFFAGVHWETFEEWVPPPLPPAAIPSSALRDVNETLGGPSLRNAKLDEQSKSKWAKFLYREELVVHAGIVRKKRGLFSKRRYLILTDQPRLLYIDEREMVEKGEIPWSPELTVERKNDVFFDIHTPGRTYHLEAVDGCGSQKWVDCIAQVKQAKFSA